MTITIIPRIIFSNPTITKVYNISLMSDDWYIRHSETLEIIKMGNFKTITSQEGGLHYLCVMELKNNCGGFFCPKTTNFYRHRYLSSHRWELYTGTVFALFDL